jgi:hypothetical protein
MGEKPAHDDVSFHVLLQMMVSLQGKKESVQMKMPTFMVMLIFLISTYILFINQT